MLHTGTVQSSHSYSYNGDLGKVGGRSVESRIRKNETGKRRTHPSRTGGTERTRTGTLIIIIIIIYYNLLIIIIAI